MTLKDSTSNTSNFDAAAKEEQLRAESEQWDLSTLEDAEEGDIPVIDLEPYFVSGTDSALNEVAEQLRIACEQTGFFSIVGHQIPSTDMDDMFAEVRRFHAMPVEIKQKILMDRADWPVGGMGYLPLKNRKLPARQTGNANEAFIIKCDDQLSMDDNQWPASVQLPGFRESVEAYAQQMELLGKRMLPVYARALDMPIDFFNEAFVKPLYRLRMTHYPSVEPRAESAFGIAPHVDTSFCTIFSARPTRAKYL